MSTVCGLETGTGDFVGLPGTVDEHPASSRWSFLVDVQVLGDQLQILRLDPGQVVT
jgi:hypothetical protein